MKKTQGYRGAKFSADVIAKASAVFLEESTCKACDYPAMSVCVGDETWSFDTIDEFRAAASSADSYSFRERTQSGQLEVLFLGTGYTQIAVSLPSRDGIQAVFEVFERHLAASQIGGESEPIKVFIGHGRDSQWRDLKDHLQDLHGLDVVAYEIGPRAGLSVKEVLEDMLSASSFALLVLTGEDEHTDGAIHARQNVVHELGLFQGRLGFTRGIALLEAGVSEFSNILGVNQIRFSKGNIRESFGDVVATIRREFGDA